MSCMIRFSSTDYDFNVYYDEMTSCSGSCRGGVVRVISTCFVLIMVGCGETGTKSEVSADVGVEDNYDSSYGCGLNAGSRVEVERGRPCSCPGDWAEGSSRHQGCVSECQCNDSFEEGQYIWSCTTNC
jgi:hypothetical protein